MSEMMSAASQPHPPSPAAPNRTSRLHHWAFALRPANNKVMESLRICVRILLIMGHEFKQTHLAIRAASLTYAILLSLVPILALSTSILKGLGSDEHLKQAAIRFIDQLEKPSWQQVQLPNSTTGSQDAAARPDSTAHDSVTTTPYLHKAVDIVFQYVERTNFAALGAFGVLGLIVVILFVLASIEEAMNIIWHTQEGRPVARKIMDYLALLILLPLSLNVALAAEAILANQSIMYKLNALLPFPWILTIGIKVAPFICIILTLMTMYVFFPHTKVKTSAALAGAVFASFFWFGFQKLYIALQVGVANYNAIYGSFASIPLFLVWLQIGWTFILLGASLAYAMQHHSSYHFSGTLLSPQRQLQIAIDILRITHDRFTQRATATLSFLSSQLPHIRRADIQQIIIRLLHGGLLISTPIKGEEAFMPATTADAATTSEVIMLILGNEPAYPSVGGTLAKQAVDAAAQTVNMPMGKCTELRNDQ
jgi:membrane protein